MGNRLIQMGKMMGTSSFLLPIYPILALEVTIFSACFFGCRDTPVYWPMFLVMFIRRACDQAWDFPLFCSFFCWVTLLLSQVSQASRGCHQEENDGYSPPEWRHGCVGKWGIPKNCLVTRQNEDKLVCF